VGWVGIPVFLWKLHSEDCIRPCSIPGRAWPLSIIITQTTPKRFI
jgi:hypothetical protein